MPLGRHQKAMLVFLTHHAGWQSLGGSASLHGLEKRTALSLERRGLIEIAKHTGDHGRDWQIRIVLAP